METEAYCIKCKAKKHLVDGQKTQTKDGRDAIQGKCETCSGPLYKILPTAGKKAA